MKRPPRLPPELLWGERGALGRRPSPVRTARSSSRGPAVPMRTEVEAVPLAGADALAACERARSTARSCWST